MTEELRGEVHFMDLTAASDIARLETELETTLGLQVKRSDPDDCPHLLGAPALLVVDNCELIASAAAVLIERLMSRNAQLFVLATSREALRTIHEHVHFLEPLAVPPPELELTVESARDWPAIQLFVDRATASGWRGAVTAEDLTTVAAICRELDGMALAIELAAGRAGAYGISGVANLLHNRFRLHWMGRRTAVPRHRTIAAMLDWSYNLLTPVEQCVLRRLSIFCGFFSLRVAQGVAAYGEVSELELEKSLANLADKSLVEVSLLAAEPRYHLLNTTRSYARLKMEESNERETVAERTRSAGHRLVDSRRERQTFSGPGSPT
jgi:predicted ATPase